MAHPSERDTTEIVLQGMGVSSGVAVGTVYLMQADTEPVATRRVAMHEVDDEIERFRAAIDTTREQIHLIQRNVQEHIGSHDARILDVHLMVLDDKVFIEEILELIRSNRHNAEHAVWVVSDRYATVLGRIDDEYLRERMTDVKDVSRRLLRHLSGRRNGMPDVIPPDSIVVADNLAPSDTALLRKDQVGGFVTNTGSPVSHTAIMARALQIPAVVALNNVTDVVSPGETLLVDGNSGVIVIRPTAKRIEACGDLINRRHRLRLEIVDRVRDQPGATADGESIALRANVDGPAELDDVLRYGAAGIGLFRSESMFLSGGRYASESEQVEVYRTLASRMQPHSVVVRTLDLGGDKRLPETMRYREDNPFLGCRGIRLCLAEEAAFRIQLRAIRMAADAGNLKIMYPMVSDVDELRRANDLLRDVCRDVASEAGHEAALEIGVMIETPAAAMCVDVIAPHVGFMSIGSNDLIQYAMAADRGNNRVSYLYQPTHPAILRLIKIAVDAADAANVPMGICGEMAGDPVLTPLLIGLGITDLSMVAAAIPMVKAVVQAVRMSEARDLVAAALRCRSSDEVLRQCRDWLRQNVPDVYEWAG